MTFTDAAGVLCSKSDRIIRDYVYEVWPAFRSDIPFLLKQTMTAATNQDWSLQDAVRAGILLESIIRVIVIMDEELPPRRLVYFTLPSIDDVISFLGAPHNPDKFRLMIPAVTNSGKNTAHAVLDLNTGDISLKGDKVLYRCLQQELGDWYLKEDPKPFQIHF